jgi:hypothetical protein
LGVSGERHGPAALPPGKTRCPLHRRLGGPQGRSGRVRKISRPPGFDPRIVQLVPIRYTDYAIPAQLSFHKISHFLLCRVAGRLVVRRFRQAVVRSVGWLVDWVFVRLFGWLID